MRINQHLYINCRYIAASQNIKIHAIDSSSILLVLCVFHTKYRYYSLTSIVDKDDCYKSLTKPLGIRKFG